MRRRTLVLCIPMMATAYPGWAGGDPQTFFVAASGNDSTGRGASNKPWDTITMALDSEPHGSLIQVKPDTDAGG